MNMRIALIGMAGVVGLGLAACSRDEPAAPSPAAQPAPATAPAAAAPPATAPAPAPEPVAAAGDVGIAECDDYLRKYEACLTGHVPAEARDMLQQSLVATRNAWRQASANAQSAEALRNACVQARDTTRASLQAYGCTDF